MSIKVYIIFGLPGAGKGYCAQALKEKRNYHHLSLGDYLRKQLEEGAKFSIEYGKSISSGLQLLPCELIQNIVCKEVEFSIANNKNIVIDGFPRTLKQVNYLDSLVKDMELSIQYVYLVVDPKLAIKRLITREHCTNCGRDYILTTTKLVGICDFCDCKLYRRSTDDKATIQKRINFFNQTTKNVIDNFTLTKQHIFTINANKSLKQIVNEFLKLDLLLS